ncbi:MAG: RNA methyltransferase [Flavobacteriaceae bacterium]
MITKKELKTISCLGLKKNRKQFGQFVAEGEKTVKALLAAGFKSVALYATQPISGIATIAVTKKEMMRMSLLKTASPLLGLFTIPKPTALPQNGRVIVLDNLSDPGNLGTIIRLCDWFGIDHLICSLETVDCYNPKVVQATMGSLARVKCHYMDLAAFFHENKRPVFGTLLDGKSIYETVFPDNAVLVLGSESHGIAEANRTQITHEVTIPRRSSQGPESLNVAMAAAVVLGEFCR